MIVTKKISLQSQGQCDIIDITRQVEQQLAETEMDSGTVTLFINGSTAGISTIEYEDGVLADFERMWDRVTERLHRGEQLSTPLYGDPLMPRFIVQMIYSGERSGKLGSVLIRVGEFLEEDLRVGIQAATKMIEPLMILVMGAIVGGIAIALLLPIFTISRVIAR